MAGPRIEYSDNLTEVIRELRRAGVSLQAAGAEALNSSAEFIEMKYRANLRDEFTLRNRFTLGAIRTMKATGVRRSGELRRLRDVNAVVGVRQLAGGRDHYLATQETGGVKRGHRDTGGRVPVPLRNARTGKNESKPVARRFRIEGNAIRQDNDMRGMNPRQMYGALRGKVKRGELNSGDMVQTEHGIFKATTRRVTMLRSTKQERIRIRPRPVFRRSVGQLSENIIVRAFLTAARRLVRAGS